jgi:mevalonate kinase
LLSGEYLVLKGAKALAFPVKFGQSLRVTENAEKGVIAWESLQHTETWFEGRFDMDCFDVLSASDAEVAQKLSMLFRILKELNPAFLQDVQAISCESQLSFDRKWGLGSSSTLVHLLSQWAQVNPYELLRKSFGGSGYDIACADAMGPLFFQIENTIPKVQEADFSPSFSDQLYFVYLGKKQFSDREVSRFSKNAEVSQQDIDRISRISEHLTKVQQQQDFDALLLEHEEILVRILNQNRIQQSLFPDFPGVVKSLGAWGGDFVLASSCMTQQECKAYFSSRNYPILIPFAEMLLS